MYIYIGYIGNDNRPTNPIPLLLITQKKFSSGTVAARHAVRLTIIY